MGSKTTLKALLSRFKLDKVQLNAGVVKTDVTFNQDDKNAAWELYVEMLTRTVTQPLPRKAGDEMTALNSVHALFGVTREILRRHGRGTIQFSKIAIPVLNQIVRPFTAKWHKEALTGAFNHESKRQEFREELEKLQGELQNYNFLLADIAGVENLTNLELTEPK